MNTAPPTHRNEQTGQASLDRIQSNVRSLIDYVRRLAASVPPVVSLALELAFTTTSATAQPTLLTFPVKAGETWAVEYWGNGSCSSTDGMTYALGAPVGSTVYGWLDSSSSNTAVANWLTHALSATPGTLTGTCHAGATNAGRPDKLNARVKVAAAGYITIMAASVTSTTTTTIGAGAYLRATKVARV